MLKGINQWNFPDGTPIEAVMAQSAAAGFEAVELNLQEPGAPGLTLESTDADVQKVKALADQYGLKLRSLSCGLYWSYPLTSNDANIRRKAGDILRKQLELAAALGADTVLVVPGVVEPDVPYDVCYKRSQDEIAKRLPEAEKLGVNIGIENVWNKFLLSPLEMARFVDEFGSPRAKAYFDCGNVLAFGYPEHWIPILGDRIIKVHIKDYRTDAGNGSLTGFVPLLAGDVNWPKVIGALREIGYHDAVTIELGLYRHHVQQVAVDASRQLDVILGRNA